MDDGWRQLQDAVFDGYEDVENWLIGCQDARFRLSHYEPMPDVHRINDMIRTPPYDLRKRWPEIDDETFAVAMDNVVGDCIHHRRVEKTGRQSPVKVEEAKAWRRDFYKGDPAARIWSHNAGLLAKWVKRKWGKPFSYMGEEGEWKDLKQDIPVLPECGVYCPRRTDDVILVGKVPPDDELDPRAAAEIQAFLRLVSLLPKDEAVEVKVFLRMRLEQFWTQYSYRSEKIHKAAAGLLKMRELATEQERVLLFHRAFLPGDVGQW